MISLAWVAPVVAAPAPLGALAAAGRNRRRLLARGGREVRPDTYRTMAALHRPLPRLPRASSRYPWRVPADVRTWACLAALAAVTALRYWAIASLGEYWNTRVVVVPGARLVRAGPYRFLRHPNYLVIVLEFLLLPLLMRAPGDPRRLLPRQPRRPSAADPDRGNGVGGNSPGTAFSPALLLPIGLLAGWGCAQKLPIDEGRLVIALPGAPVNVDPRLATDAYGEQILQMTHASLVRPRRRRGAPSPTSRSGGRRPTRGRTCSTCGRGCGSTTGRPLTSADVRYTFAWILDPANRSPHRATVPAPGRRSRPPTRGPSSSASPSRSPRSSPRWCAASSPSGSPARGYTPPAGAGPYRIDDVSPDGEAVLSAFDGYVRRSARDPRGHGQVHPRQQRPLPRAEDGERQLLPQRGRPRPAPGGGAARTPRRRGSARGERLYLGFNLRDRALSDARVRRAIALAIDREAIVRTIWKGRADLVDSILPPGSWAHEPDLPAVPSRPGAGAAPPRRGRVPRSRRRRSSPPPPADVQDLAERGAPPRRDRDPGAAPPGRNFR